MDQQITVTDDMLGSLRATRPWVMFLAILGFVGLALMVMGSLWFIGFSTMLPANSKLPGAFGVVAGCVELAIAAVYFFPCFYLLRYANAIERIAGTGQAAMEQALRQQKSFWKFMGIFAIVMLVVYVLMIVGAILAGGFYAASHHP